MSRSLKHLIAGCLLLVLASGIASLSGESPGSLEGHLRIISPSPVEPDDVNAVAEAAEDYADYPLLVLSRDGQKEIARVTADAGGNYRVALPPGDYILDVQGRTHKHVRAKARPFTVVSNQTVRVDVNIELDHSRSSAQSVPD
jgi:hypothetical protein